MPEKKSTTGQNLTPPRASAIWEKAFFGVLSKTGNVTEACDKAKITRSAAYQRRDADASFKQRWDDARMEAADRLEQEAYRRAVKGVKKPVYQQKELVGYVQEYSDQLLLRLLEANNPNKFRRNVDLTTGGDKLPSPVVYLPEVQDET